jgi:hypothetical protein
MKFKNGDRVIAADSEWTRVVKVPPGTGGTIIDDNGGACYFVRFDGGYEEWYGENELLPENDTGKETCIAYGDTVPEDRTICWRCEHGYAT